MLAARIIVAIENPADVCVIAARPYGQRAVLKYAQYTGAQYIAGRFTPGAFTNQIQKKFMEPRLCALSMLPSQPTTRPGFPLVCCTGCSHVRCSVFVALSPAHPGMWWWTCSSTVTPRRLRSSSRRPRPPEMPLRQHQPPSALLLLSTRRPQLPPWHQSLMHPHSGAKKLPLATLMQHSRSGVPPLLHLNGVQVLQMLVPPTWLAGSKCMIRSQT